MFKAKLLTLILIFICSFVCVHAEELSLDIPSSSKPTGGIHFEAVEMFDGEASANFYAASSSAGLTAEEYIIQECMKHTQTINLERYRMHIDDVADLFFTIALENPELMVHSGFRYSANSNKIAIRISPYYLHSSLAETNRARTFMEEKITEYIDYASNCPDTLGKILLIHDKMTEDCVYDYESTESDVVNDYSIFHAYGVFANERAVCQGFSQALFAIYKRLGIDTSYVQSDSLNHIWNYIEYDNQWYHLDLTWDELEDSTLNIHNFFLLSDETMSTTHGKKSTWSYYTGGLKNCTSKKFEKNYFFKFPAPVHISYDGKKYTMQYTISKRPVTFESDTLYTGPVITSAPISTSSTQGKFYAVSTDNMSDMTDISVISLNNKIRSIKTRNVNLKKNTINEFSYSKGNPNQVFTWMYMDLKTLIPYSKKVTVN